MFNGHKVVVTMTSWTKRIGNCYQVVKSILNNTMQPDVVYLNLSVEEFPKRDQDLPKDLVQLAQEQQTFKINWVEGPNTKTMKKVFPILKYLDDDDIILTVDDDLVVPKDLIQIRLDEFKQHEGMFAISGGTNPKWHLNKKLFGGSFTYNILTSTSIFKKKMLNGWNKMICDDLIQTYNDDCTYTMLVYSNGFNVLPSKVLSTWSGVTNRKVGFSNSIEPMKGRYKSDDDVIKLFSCQFEKVYGHSFRDGLFRLVIWDSWDVSGDNGEYMYRVIREKFPFIKPTYLLSRKSKDWDRLSRDGFDLYPFEGEDLEILMRKASFIVFSKDIGNTTKAGQLQQIHRSKTIFLQHGMISKIYDIGNYLKGNIASSSRYICCNSQDEANLVKRYSNGKMVSLIMGQPRHDTLLEKNIKRKTNVNGDCKTVFISFHWRHWVQVNSQYFTDINKLLNDERLKKLHDSGVKICFLPHARFMMHMSKFKIPKFVDVPINKPFQDILVDSDILVTDFSSNSFEMAYMNKPSIIFVPGILDVRSTQKKYHIENMNYPHMSYCDSLDKVFQKMEEFTKKDVRFDFASKLFKYVDTNNTERLVEWMLKQYGVSTKNVTNTKRVVDRKKQLENDLRTSSNQLSVSKTEATPRLKGNRIYRFVRLMNNSEYWFH